EPHEEMIEHEAEGSVATAFGRGEGVVQVGLLPSQHDVALEFGHVRPHQGRPAGVDRPVVVVQGQEAQIAAAKTLSHALLLRRGSEASSTIAMSSSEAWYTNSPGRGRGTSGPRSSQRRKNVTLPNSSHGEARRLRLRLRSCGTPPCWSARCRR